VPRTNTAAQFVRPDAVTNYLVISHRQTALTDFLPRDAMRKRDLSRRAVSVRLSATYHILNCFSPSDSHVILCRRSSRLEQFVVIDAECTFVAAAEMRTVPSLLRFVLTDRPTLF